MSRLGAVILVVGVSFGVACSSGVSSPEPHESTGQTAQAITAVCSLETIGLPCDPDGPAGAKLECEGQCAIATSGYPTCQSVSIGSMDGIICGTTNGVGNAACKRYCSGRTCLAQNAPAGAACRPKAGSNPCEGQCNGAGSCDNVPQACAFGRVDQLCKFNTCSFANATTCLSRNLRTNTTCSLSDACSIGKCSAGVCNSTGAVGCDDGNACTDDACDSQEGGCNGTPDDTNSCSDSNACTTGDRCSNGVCLAGTEAPDCDDGNACTVDSCDPNTGCAHVPVGCSDGNECTDDVCDPATGACSNPVKVCSDQDACTTDACVPATGCAFTAIDCDDDNACTADSCAAGDCEHVTVACDDGDACTSDSCDVQSGCVYEPIADCGSGGQGGEPSVGGTGGLGGSGTGGTSGEAGAPVVEGGAPGNAGTGPMPTAGSGGATPAGGTASSGGTNPTGGTGATAGSGATAGTDVGGEAQGGSAGTTSEQVDGGDSTSCGCRLPGSSRQPAAPWMVLGLLGVALARFRRRAAPERGTPRG